MIKPLLALLFSGICASGCATHNATTLVKALKNDPAGFSLSVVGWGANIHIVRANPGSNTPPYTIGSDGTVRVLESNRDAVLTLDPGATRDEVLLQAIKRIPAQPQVQ